MAEEVSEQTGPTVIPPENPVPPAPPEIKPEKPKRKISLSAVLIVLFIILVTALAIGTIFYAKQNQAKIAAINDFESCATAGNPIMESYPEQCSANGQTFTRVLSEEEQKKLTPDPSPAKSVNQTKKIIWDVDKEELTKEEAEIKITFENYPIADIDIAEPGYDLAIIGVRISTESAEYAFAYAESRFEKDTSGFKKGEVVPGEGSIFLLFKTNGVWELFSRADEEFCQVLLDLPFDLMSDDEKSYFGECYS